MNTKQLTRGAMMCGIYGLLLFLNQQTALTIESAASWVFAFPILIYSAMYGSGLGSIVAVAMALLTVLFGGFTTWFYSWTSIVIGHVYGLCVHRHFKHMTSFIVTAVLSIITTAMIIYLWAGIFGYNLATDFEEIMRFAPFVPMRVLVFVFVVFMGILQALCIHMVALMIFARIKIETQPITPLSKVRSPKWLGIVSIGIVAIYILSQNMVNLNAGIKDMILIILIFDLALLDYYGVVYFLSRVVELKVRMLSFFAILGAFIPVVSTLWIIMGELECLFQLRQRRLDKRV